MSSWCSTCPEIKRRAEDVKRRNSNADNEDIKETKYSFTERNCVMKTYYIGADVHCNNTELAIEHKGKIIARHSINTGIRSISEVLDSLGGNIHLTFEESTMSGWLYRNLKDKVNKLIVCDPRRNKLIADEGDKDDIIDATKLAALLRGGFLKPVYHTIDLKRLELKRWVALYTDRVRETTRYINKIRAEARLYGVKIPSEVFRKPELRQLWLSSHENENLAKRITILLMGYDASRLQKNEAKTQMILMSIHYPIIGYWRELPGIGPIRAITMFAYLDTPFRFKSKSALWKYCGLGLTRKTSGKDKNGRNKPTKMRLEYRCNHILKGVIIGASRSAIHQKVSIFRDCYERMIMEGKSPSNARHAVGRKLLTIMWGMWKSNSAYIEGV